MIDTSKDLPSMEEVNAKLSGNELQDYLHYYNDWNILKSDYEAVEFKASEKLTALITNPVEEDIFDFLKLKFRAIDYENIITCIYEILPPPPFSNLENFIRDFFFDLHSIYESYGTDDYIINVINRRIVDLIKDPLVVRKIFVDPEGFIGNLIKFIINSEDIKSFKKQKEDEKINQLDSYFKEIDDIYNEIFGSGDNGKILTGLNNLLEGYFDLIAFIRLIKNNILKPVDMDSNKDLVEVIIKEFKYALRPERIKDFLSKQNRSDYSKYNVKNLNSFLIEKLFKKIALETRVEITRSILDSEESRSYLEASVDGIKTNKDLVNSIVKKTSEHEVFWPGLSKNFSENLKKIIETYINKYLPKDGFYFWANINNSYKLLDILKTSVLVCEKLNKLNTDSLDRIFKQLFNLRRDILGIPLMVEFYSAGIRSEESLITDVLKVSEVLRITHNQSEDISSEEILDLIQSNISKSLIIVNFVEHSEDYPAYDTLVINSVTSDVTKKILSLISLIMSLEGVKNIEQKYSDTIKSLTDKNLISQNIIQHLNEVFMFYKSGKELHPSKPYFKSIKKLIISVSSDLDTIINYNAFKKYYDEAGKNKKIPELFLLNMQINNQVRFRVLKDLDPRHLNVGQETDCCQRQHGAGELAMVDSFVNPEAGVLLLEYLENNEWELAAQSYFHYVPPGRTEGKPGTFNYKRASLTSDEINKGGYILDSIEPKVKAINEIPIEDYYAYWAVSKKRELGIGYIQTGTQTSRIDLDKFQSVRFPTDPRNFYTEDTYTDWIGGGVELTKPNFTSLIDSEINEKIASLSRLFLTISY